MPRISGWDGTTIWMYYAEEPREAPHFHALCDGVWVQIEIATGDVLHPPRGARWSGRELRRVERWRQRHETELTKNWERARQGVPLELIPGDGEESDDGSNDAGA